MAIYEYQCSTGHISERIRKYEQRDDTVLCDTCQGPTTRIVSLPHCPPDGVYSYAPNIGSANAFEKRRQAMKDGVKVMPKIRD